VASRAPVNKPERAFARLLAALNPDVDRAGDAYEHLRRALIRFFEWRDVHPADECADITLDRLERKLGDTTPILDVQAFAYGIARMVMFERLRRPVALPLEEAANIRAPEEATGDQREAAVRDCFEDCLERLPQDSQRLVLRYYEQQGRARIEARRALAGTLGLTENALRIRVQRLRDRLEACIGTCLSRNA
jgi:DNA-directed RNA polymerase specialized sigma24 family protein